MTDDPAPFGAKNTYGMISGAKNYLAMIKKVGDPDGDEKLGYYGESLVLLATGLGLGTCWLAGTYNKSECNVKVEDDEVLRCIIVFGNVKDRETLKEKAISKTVKRNSKEIKDLLLLTLSETLKSLPDGRKSGHGSARRKNEARLMIFCAGNWKKAGRPTSWRP